jgi:MFS family permease
MHRMDAASTGSLPSLIFFRVLQGAAGGSLQPTTRAIMLEAFAREERAQAMALSGVGIVIAPIVAPMPRDCDARHDAGGRLSDWETLRDARSVDQWIDRLRYRRVHVLYLIEPQGTG